MSEEPNWHYTQNKTPHGPVSEAELKQLAQRGELLADSLVWREGMSEWVRAETIHGLFPEQRLLQNHTIAPPLPPPIQPPVSGTSRATSNTSGSGNLREIALRQRWLLLSILGYFPAFYVWQLLFVVIPLEVACFSLLANSLKWPTGKTLVYAVLMLIPYLGILFLLLLNQSATKRLQAAGVRVGFMGASIRDLPVA